MNSKRRLSASIDGDLLNAAEDAVRRGTAASVSAWVNEAFRRQLEHERKMAAMSEFLAEFEAEFGEISNAEIDVASKRARSTATVVRSRIKSDGFEPAKIPRSKSLTKRRSA
jgi:hypothetical protein